MCGQMTKTEPKLRHARCGAPTSFEDVSDGYYAQCPECDEDLFSFETYQNAEHDEMLKDEEYE